MSSVIPHDLQPLDLPGRDPFLPKAYYRVDHPLRPLPNKAIVFIVDISPANMAEILQWEKVQHIPANDTGNILCLCSFRCKLERIAGLWAGTPYTPMFSRAEGSTDPWKDVYLGVLTPASHFPQDVKDNLRAAVDAAMGPLEEISLERPTCDDDGNWSGGLAIERGEGGCNPVKPGCRCYTIANSYQSAKGVMAPVKEAKVVGGFSENNLMRRNITLAIAPFGIASMDQAPSEVADVIRDYTSMLNIPPLGLPGNTFHNTLQMNVAPAVAFGSKETLKDSLSTFGEIHNDEKDSPARLTTMTMCSCLPDDYTLSKFYIPRLGVVFTLSNFDSLSFCGLSYHGGSPAIAPEGQSVAKNAYCLTFIQYPPERMGDGLGHVVVGALPTANDRVLKMSAEMQNVDCESRYFRASSTQANFATDGQMALGRRSGHGENGPGARVLGPSPAFSPSDDRALVLQSERRAEIMRRWRLHYNKFAAHNPYAVVQEKGYEIDENGELLQQPKLITGAFDTLGNPIETQGRGWADPGIPVSAARLERRLKAKADRERRKKEKEAAAAAAGPINGLAAKAPRKRQNRGRTRSETAELWNSKEYIELRAAATRGAKLNTGLIVNVSDAEQANTDMDVDVDDAVDHFLGGTVASLEIKIVQRLEGNTVEREFGILQDAYYLVDAETVAEPFPTSAITVAFASMLSCPGSVETSLHISRIWPQFEQIHVSEAQATLDLKLRRQSIMQTTFGLWTWLDAYCVEVIRQAPHDAAPETWIGRLAKHVFILLSTRAPSRELRSEQYGLAIGGVYTYTRRTTFDLDVPEPFFVALVIDIIASWLRFPVKSRSRAQAWFVECIVRAGNPDALLLDCVWYAFGHYETEVFGDARFKVKSPADFRRFASALACSALVDKKSTTAVMLSQMRTLLYEYQNCRLQSNLEPAPTRLQLTNEDSAQLRLMNRFLDYLLELEPLLDGYHTIARPTVLQARVNANRDYLLPFREHGPSRIHSRGPGCSFDPAHARTIGEAPTTFFPTPQAWRTEVEAFAGRPDTFFCNLSAYSKHKSNRGTHLVQLYWDAIHTEGCPDWARNTGNGAYEFRKCFEFLSCAKPCRFREIGNLIGFLLTADFHYAGAVQAPSVNTVSQIIRDINAGGVKGLEMLELVPLRLKLQHGFQKATLENVQAGFARLYRFLDARLGDKKTWMVFDAIMVENGLCKFVRAVGAKFFTL
ncbi:hypothetical protein C8J57DRAFT_1620987 [Mycena rebaudengoi]|nr:hypothetical protein C8J57DRAFT_1620987 [Mycena rebaudengoi]